MLFNILTITAKEKERDMTNRSRTDIISDILKAANGGGARRTKIMFHAYLSYVQLKDYLIVLTQNGLLSYDLDTRTFKTTEKGLKFLEVYNQMDDMIKTLAHPLSQQQVQER